MKAVARDHDRLVRELYLPLQAAGLCKHIASASRKIKPHHLLDAVSANLQLCINGVFNCLLDAEVHRYRRHGERDKDHDQVPDGKPNPDGYGAHVRHSADIRYPPPRTVSIRLWLRSVSIFTRSDRTKTSSVFGETSGLSLQMLPKAPLGEDMTRASHQVLQQRKLPSRQYHGHPGAADFSAFRVENQVADLHKHLFHCRSFAGHRAKPRHKLRHRKRRREVVINTEIERGHDV